MEMAPGKRLKPRHRRRLFEAKSARRLLVMVVRPVRSTFHPSLTMSAKLTDIASNTSSGLPIRALRINQIYGGGESVTPAAALATMSFSRFRCLITTCFYTRRISRILERGNSLITHAGVSPASALTVLQSTRTSPNAGQHSIVENTW
jgi:hypothetical protein